MDLKNSLALLERKKMELAKEYEEIQNELEHILFDSSFNYQKAFTDESENYFIYPCIQPSNGFKSISVRYQNDDNCIKKSHFLFLSESNLTIVVTEFATLEKKMHKFSFNKIKGNITTYIISKISYTVSLGKFEFKFSKNFCVNNYLEYYDEKLKLNIIKESLETASIKNPKMESDFSACLHPYHFNETASYSLSEYINKSLKTSQKDFLIDLGSNILCLINFERSVKSFPMNFDFNCNKCRVTIFGEFLAVNYSARILFQSLIDRKKISGFSDSGYGIIMSKVPEEEIEIKRLFFN